MSGAVIGVAVGGASGRMGRAVCAAVLDAPDLRLVGGCGQPGGELSGHDLGILAGRGHAGVLLQSDAAQASQSAQVWIDFSSNAGLAANLDRLPMSVRGAIIGVTGHNGAAQDAVERCADQRAVVQSGNFSLGISVLQGLVQAAAARLGPQWDIEILEHHHRHKRDAPSGTALMLGAAAARGRGHDLAHLRLPPHDDKTGLRPEGGIGFASLRGGATIGEHAVLLAGPRETLTLAHCAQDRAVFADGALVAARWALSQPAGLYSMQNVLGFAI